MCTLRKTLTLLMMVLAVAFFPHILWAQPQVSATNAVLIEAESGEIIYNKNAFEAKPPASTTKVLTALLAVDMTSPDEIVKVSKNAATTGEASIHLREGEQLTVEQLVKGALIKSGNDAAVALAEHVAGNVELFSLLMNQKARLLGAKNSNFVNPNGLPDEQHRSSAYDLAIITSYALTKDIFANTVEQKNDTIPWQGQGKRYLKNTNRLLWKYSGANGVKTGTTRAAGSCLVASASRNGMQLISVVLKSGDRYGDSINILDYGFRNYQVEHIAKGTLWTHVVTNNGLPRRVPVVTVKPLTLVYEAKQSQLLEKRVQLSRVVEAPLTRGTRVGTLSLYIDNEEKMSTPLVIGTDIRQKNK